MIVTMMFAQACLPAHLYFGDWTRGDEGFSLPRAARRFALGAHRRPRQPDRPLQSRAAALLRSRSLVTFALVRSPSAACSSPSARTRSARRCSATTPFATSSSRSSLSGTIAAAAGAAYALLFAYVGATFASIQYSIFPLLWTLLGGADRRSGRSSARCSMYLSRRHHQRIHLGLSARRRRRARPPHPLLPARHPRDAPRKLAAVAAVTLLSTTQACRRHFGGLQRRRRRRLRSRRPARSAPSSARTAPARRRSSA